MNNIDVYILSSNNNSKDVETLEKLFSSSIFSVKIVPLPKKLDIPTTLSVEDFYIHLCLEQTHSNNPSRGVICIKDSSITNISPNNLSDLCLYIQKKDLDLFYFCRWLDTCQKIIDITTIPVINIAIGKTFSPQGFQAVYFSQNGREILLGNVPMKNKKFLLNSEENLHSEINKGNIITYCALNNVFNFNIERATSNSDYLKTHECLYINSIPDNNTPNLGIIWFLVVVILVVLVSFAIIRIGKK